MQQSRSAPTLGLALLSTLAVVSVACGPAATDKDTPSTQGRDAGTSGSKNGNPAATEGNTTGAVGDKPAANKGGGPRDRARDPETLRLAKASRKEFLALLEQGRSLSASGKRAEAIVVFRKALAIDANSATVLGETGWAAFGSGELGLAKIMTRQALANATSDKQRGMLHYNLGRIAEESGDAEGAIIEYRDSLSLRDNKTVKERLDKLLAGRPVPERDLSSTRLLSGAADLEAICVRLRDDLCEIDFDVEEGDGCDCRPELALASEDVQWGLLEVASKGSINQRAWYPVVRMDAGWSLFDMIDTEYNPGMFGISEEIQLGSITVEDGPVAGSQLATLTVSKGRFDMDMGLCEAESEDHALVMFCARAGAYVACSHSIAASWRYDRDVEEGICEQIEGEEPIKHDPPIAMAYSAELTVKADGLHVDDVKAEGGVVTGVDTYPLRLAPGIVPLTRIFPGWPPQPATP